MEIKFEVTLDRIYVRSLPLPKVFEASHSRLPGFFLALVVLLLVACFVDHIVQKGSPDASEIVFWFPLGLLSNLAIFVVQIKPIPFIVFFSVSAEFIEFNLLLMVATIDEVVELIFAFKTCPPHASFGTTLLESFARLPALAPSYFVCFHFQSVFFDTSENIESPVVPHRWTSLNDVIWLWMKSRQVLYGGVQFLV